MYQLQSEKGLKACNWTDWRILMRRPAAFKKTDVTRATRAVCAAGLEVARVEIEKDGRLVVVIGKQKALDISPDGEQNPWDQVLNNAAN
jgi:hypothetical protein